MLTEDRTVMREEDHKMRNEDHHLKSEELIWCSICTYRIREYKVGASELRNTSKALRQDVNLEIWKLKFLI